MEVGRKEVWALKEEWFSWAVDEEARRVNRGRSNVEMLVDHKVWIRARSVLEERKVFLRVLMTSST